MSNGKLTRMKVILGFLMSTFLVASIHVFFRRSNAMDWLRNTYRLNAIPTPMNSTSIFHIAPIEDISQILVISLPRRVDRRKDMDKMKDYFHFDWTYVDAFDSNETVIDNVLQQVREIRSHLRLSHRENSTLTYKTTDSDPWLHMKTILGPEASEPMACAKEEDTIPDFTSELHSYEILSRGMIACWLSHLMALRIAVVEEGPTMILEDDVDFDWQFTDILNSNWHALPASWEMVYLGISLPFAECRYSIAHTGYCWSNETEYEPLPLSSLIRPSYAPKCSHGYVVSPTGAQKLLGLLRKPVFAFSRALDQALVHLIQEKEIEAYSFVPSLVVQTKNSISDIWHGNTTDGFGSSWRERLARSTRRKIGGLE
jgi:GR25 family glycosyltransferase involved in LPS biosynthesis